MAEPSARLMALAVRRVNIQKRIVKRRAQKLERSQALLDRLKAAEARLIEEQARLKIIELPKPESTYKTTHQKRMEKHNGIYWADKLKGKAVCIILMFYVFGAMAQKQASQLLPTPKPSPVSAFALPKLEAIPAAVSYQDQSFFTVGIIKTNAQPVDGYFIRWGTATNALTNVTFTVKTNLTIGPTVDGQSYWLAATSVLTNNGFPSEGDPIISGPFAASCWVMMATHTRAITTRGVTGKTNLLQFANDISGTNWKTGFEFIGDGSLKTIIRTNTAKEFFRVIHKP